MRNGGPTAYRPDRRTATGRTPRPAAPPATEVAFDEAATRLADSLVHTGLPPMMARVLTALLTTESGSLTSADLVRRLRVSPASISKAVAYLEDMRILKRGREPGRRAERYLVEDDVWLQAMLVSARANTVIAEAASRSAQAVGATTPVGVRLENMAHFLVHVGEDLVRSAEHWYAVYAPKRPQ
jgi:DNA-binding transcriptional ArsR family regulator